MQKVKDHPFDFADDLLLFRRADVQSIRALYDRFSKFSKSSGLEANSEKCEIFFAGVSEAIKEEICSMLRMQKG